MQPFCPHLLVRSAELHRQELQVQAGQARLFQQALVRGISAQFGRWMIQRTSWLARFFASSLAAPAVGRGGEPNSPLATSRP